jgi:hypothetical protein
MDGRLESSWLAKLNEGMIKFQFDDVYEIQRVDILQSCSERIQCKNMTVLLDNETTIRVS